MLNGETSRGGTEADADVETADGPVRAADPRRRGAEGSSLALVVVWSGSEPARVGEILLPLPGTAERRWEFGRGGRPDGPDTGRMLPVQQRPGVTSVGSPLHDPFLSRQQLLLRFFPNAIHVENVGKRALVIRGSQAEAGEIREGDLLECKDVLLLLCVRRPPQLATTRHAPSPASHAFGLADIHGLVGESPSAWQLRDEIAFAAGQDPHALLLGESGTGKELVAQAIHAASDRARHRLVARNAATLPPGLIDAELFGNAAGYPQGGMPERHGLVGDADGGTLFLDEVGELTQELQSHLLRVLDAGEYQRLGETKRRVANFRMIGATNRPAPSLRNDLLARLPLRLSLPPLGSRREDIPLLARHLLCRIAAKDGAVARRYFDSWDEHRQLGVPRLSIDLMRVLVQHPYTTNVRELELLLWESLRTSAGETFELTEAVRDLAASDAPAPTEDPNAEQVRAALERAGGVQARAWRQLGLKNRFALRRLMKRYGIAALEDA
jgi:two-component system nitrogen regulation response regulator GlnG/two-component system response regulator HydG